MEQLIQYIVERHQLIVFYRLVFSSDEESSQIFIPFMNVSKGMCVFVMAVDILCKCNY